MSDNVIDLAARRTWPGTVFWSGSVCCTACGAGHVAVIPMPDWAAAVPAIRCPKCAGLTCLAVADGETGGAWTPPVMGSLAISEGDS
jgi:hypothetical protein